MEKFLMLLNEMSPYLLLGFLLAGLMHAFIPGNVYRKYLSKNNMMSVINAALIGIPLPLCSCGVIPTAMSLRKEGASKGAVVSFLISTPQTGVDSIIATYGLMGLPFAIIRPIAALVTAMFGGGMSVQCGVRSEQCEVGSEQCEVRSEQCGVRSEQCEVGSGLREALVYGYYTMMQDIGKWLVIGLVVAALITIFVPTSWFAVIQDNTLMSMLLVLVIAIPMYVCATGSIPIAVALMMKGLTPGAALVFLMAGPASNLASMLVVRKVMGRKTLAVYLLSIVLGAIAFGMLIDYLQYNGIVNFLGSIVSTKACCMDHTSWFSWLCSAVLVLLLINALVLPEITKTQTLPFESLRINSAQDKLKTKTKTQTQTKTDTKMKTVHIEGMSCNHCRMSAEKAILGVPGVTSATVDLQKKEAQVEGDASFEDIQKAIEEVGFTCTPL